MLCVSIDLDPLRCYRELYGLPPAEPAGSDPVYGIAVERFCDWLAELGAPGTIFAVGEALAAPDAAASIRAAAARGIEIANHSQSHRYDLSRLADAEMQAEIALGADAIERACGTRPRGFRAPGYLLGDRVLAAAEAAGARYDASALPSPAYQAVKLAAVGLLALAGRGSAAIAGDPREALGPRAPYRPDRRRPWRRGAAGLLELPVSTALGLPLTGGLLALAGRRAAAALGRLLSRRAFVQLELHGVDLLDIETDGLDPALGVQRDLRIGHREKRACLSAFVEPVLARHEPLSLAAAERQFLVPSSKP
ncbi:MAG: polysaccharide deacetylase family protein [Deltaproteobacteria bacterium]|nr:polysaccharide deacetylase family protein [Deltaproteobacteria bacterium]